MQLDMGLPPTVPAVATTKRSQGVRAQITHDMIVDFVMLNVTATYEEIGRNFGYSAGGMKTIMRSDAFRARFEARKTSLIDPLVLEKMEKRLEGLAEDSIKIIQKHLETSTDANFALKVLGESSRALGYGAAKAAPAQQNNFVVHLPGPAQSSEAWSAAFAGHSSPGPTQVVDAEVKDA